ncbi:hypothetical protein G9C98_007721 [Cotesia typhae]|uniref:Uncharacterized protein n=1 Tax=Cotesia typhae TaxID=2053667 RepID=A0A8J5QV58_9HYME|nr:hypothetical protein G9C98_007721 [Cotesia typhae]
MALCVRAIPNKILSFVGTISQTQLDRRLARLIGTSQFLHETQCVPRKSSPELIIPSAYNARECLNNFKKNTNEIKLYAVASQLPKKSVDLPKQDEFSGENPDQNSNHGQPTSETLLNVYKTLQTDGQVYRHVADKMMPDEEMTPDKGKPDIAAKLAA